MSDAPVRFEVLGPLRVTRGQEQLQLGPAKQQAVLATLLAAPNEVVPTARIIAAVWGDEPPVNGTNVVQKYVAGLRRVLEPDRLPRAAGNLLPLEDGGYRVVVAPGSSDVDEFEVHLQAALEERKAGRLDNASRELEQALQLWRSDPFEGHSGPLFDEARKKLQERRTAASEERADIVREQSADRTAAGRRDGRSWALGRGWPVSLTDVIPPQRPLAGRVLMKASAVLIGLVTLGFGTAVLLGVVAYLRRNRRLTQLAALYLVIWLIGVVLFFTGAVDDASVANNLGLVLVLLVTVVGSIQLATAVAPISVRRIRGLAALDQRQRAREVVARDPEHARTLGIGRPHLQREYDDGGLVDPNDVPAGVLTRIPGITAQHAALIVASREREGRFSTVDDLADRELFPSPLPDAVATFLVVLPAS
ncbi:hypothetical protein E1263_27975 [Kribbella antibiotica]|uniref:OmpR/PhoB-type domain-containing protein n=1 Tax=Kribbella antibiotica TaxID=190195 RepID=A0A4R4Z8N4_9ACTN|nr:winged helix-turn-helix domain-containing protein [Kribbella antibiotica]TDD53449.1 hypothetical protein E1263_27975 [Kribbella antibiotica]